MRLKKLLHEYLIFFQNNYKNGWNYDRSIILFINYRVKSMPNEPLYTGLFLSSVYV